MTLSCNKAKSKSFSQNTPKRKIDRIHNNPYNRKLDILITMKQSFKSSTPIFCLLAISRLGTYVNGSHELNDVHRVLLDKVDSEAEGFISTTLAQCRQDQVTTCSSANSTVPPRSSTLALLQPLVMGLMNMPLTDVQSRDDPIFDVNDLLGTINMVETISNQSFTTFQTKSLQNFNNTNTETRKAVSTVVKSLTTGVTVSQLILQFLQLRQNKKMKLANHSNSSNSSGSFEDVYALQSTIFSEVLSYRIDGTDPNVTISHIQKQVALLQQSTFSLFQSGKKFIKQAASEGSSGIDTAVGGNSIILIMLVIIITGLLIFISLGVILVLILGSIAFGIGLFWFFVIQFFLRIFTNLGFGPSNDDTVPTDDAAKKLLQFPSLYSSNIGSQINIAPMNATEALQVYFQNEDTNSLESIAALDVVINELNKNGELSMLFGELLKYEGTNMYEELSCQVELFACRIGYVG